MSRSRGALPEPVFALCRMWQLNGLFIQAHDGIRVRAHHLQDSCPALPNHRRCPPVRSGCAWAIARWTCRCARSVRRRAPAAAGHAQVHRRAAGADRAGGPGGQPRRAAGPGLARHAAHRRRGHPGDHPAAQGLRRRTRQSALHRDHRQERLSPAGAGGMAGERRPLPTAPGRSAPVPAEARRRPMRGHRRPLPWPRHAAIACALARRSSPARWCCCCWWLVLLCAGRCGDDRATIERDAVAAATRRPAARPYRLITSVPGIEADADACRRMPRWWPTSRCRRISAAPRSWCRPPIPARRGS